MATSTEGVVGRGALLIGHAAGMLDLVSMPLWIGVLIQFRHMSPVRGGLVVDRLYGGVFLTSVSLAPRFDRLPARLIAIGGFIVGALAFFGIIKIDGFAVLAAGAFHGRNRRRFGSVDGARHDLSERSATPLCSPSSTSALRSSRLLSSPQFRIWCSITPMYSSMFSAAFWSSARLRQRQPFRNRRKARRPRAQTAMRGRRGAVAGLPSFLRSSA